jgi:hypothetical protein
LFVYAYPTWLFALEAKTALAVALSNLFCVLFCCCWEFGTLLMLSSNSCWLTAAFNFSFRSSEKALIGLRKLMAFHTDQVLDGYKHNILLKEEVFC